MSKIISVNSGSSSLKFQLFDMPEEKVLISGLAERIGQNMGAFSVKVNGQKFEKELPIPNHKKAVELLLESLKEHNIVKDFDEIQGAGHRIVQGGSFYDKSVIATEEVVKNVDDLSILAPLHNPAHLICYKAFTEVLPNIGHVFVFDTAFHQSMPEESYIFPVPYEWYTDHQIRRYGAHGTSHQYVAYRTAELMNKDIKDLNIITCHLGNGASITAVKGGKSINTSMGLSPLGGIMMGTRCGDIDPTIVYYMMKKLNLTPEEMDVYLNKKSGMLGISGISSDARDIDDAAKAGNERAILTQKLYVTRCISKIAEYYMQLGSVDAISFTAGLGENDATIREMVLKGLEKGMGIKADYELNSKSRGKEVKISLDDSKVSAFIVPTMEELMIARDTYNLLNA